MSENGKPVRFDCEGHVAILTLNRQDKRNAVDAALANALSAALDRFEGDGNLRVAILTGAGEKAFCAGMDLAAFAHGQGPEIIEGPGGFAGFTSRMRTKPVIAAVNGFALGGGAELLLACDMAIGAEHAGIGFPEVMHGLFPGAGGAIRLPRAIPRNRAMELLLTGRIMDAAEAWSLGLFNRVVPGDRLMDAAREMAETIAGNAPLAVRETLALARASVGGDPDIHRLNKEAWQRVAASEDAREGPRAFMDKRAPVWKGR